MSLSTRKRQAAATSAAARDRARQAAQQIAPLAQSARENAARQIHATRRWAAPRIQQAARGVQENVAPMVSAALEATATKIEPAPEQVRKPGRRAARADKASQRVSARREKIRAKASERQRRWPKVMGGLAVALAAAGAAATVVKRRGKRDDFKEAMTVPGTDEAQPAPAEAEAGFDGQVRTS